MTFCLSHDSIYFVLLLVLFTVGTKESLEGQ